MFGKLLKGLAGQRSTRIAFDRTGEYVDGCPVGIYTINPDGRDCRHIRATGDSPRWSPDGRWIGYVEKTKDNGWLHSVFVMRPDGSDARRLTFHHDVMATAPAWSPDSKWLAYSLWLWQEKRSELCVVNLGTKEWKHVIYTEDQIYPVWGASNKIMFSLYNEGAVPRLFEVGPDGQGLRECVGFEPGDSEPMWTPDGSKVVFGRDGGLVIRDESGGHTHLISMQRGAAIQWDIAPDGQRVVYTGQQTDGAGFEVFVADVNSGSIRQLVSNPIVHDHEVDSRCISWSPCL